MRRALLALCAAGCTAITHATAYRTAPDTRACALCPSRPDLRHAPCPPAAAPSGPEATRVYALRAIDLGADYSDPGYAVGLDLDCSDRPNAGRPVECGADAPLAPNMVWEPLPRGIDNAFGAQTFGALRATPGLPSSVTDFSGTLGRAYESGRAGMILTIEGWNGLADDDDVRPRLQVARGVTTGASDCASAARPAPKWDGADVWDVYDGSGFAGGGAYVVGGQLVWDARAAPAEIHLENNTGVLEMRLLDTILVGAISPDAIEHLTLSARWSVTGAHMPIGFLAGGDPAAACAINHALPWIVIRPPLAAPGPVFTDVRTARPPANTPMLPTCEAISVGLDLDFARAAGTAPIACVPPFATDFEPHCLPDGGPAP
jgi:hypothetical protein